MARPASTAFRNDFSDYPSGTIQCLNNASNSSGCTGDTSEDMNACLCSDGGSFASDSAKCIAQHDPGDMTSTWEILQLHCSDSNTPLSISLSRWMAIASGITTSTSATPTSTAGADTDDEERCSLSSSAKTGIIAGSLGAGFLLLSVALFFCLRHRRRRYQYGEVQPTQLAQSGHSDTSLASSELESPLNMGIPVSNITNTRRRPINTPSAPWSPGAFDRTSSGHTSDFYQPQAFEVVHEMPDRHLHGPLSPSSAAPATRAEMPMAAIPVEAASRTFR